MSVDGYVGASPAIASGCAYFGTFENEVLAVDLKNNQVLWRFEPEREFGFYSSAAVTEDLVIIGGRDKNVHAIDRTTGERLWAHPTGARVDASPVVVGRRVGRLVISTVDGMVLCLGE